MNIGIDIDGTINENFPIITELAHTYFNRPVPIDRWQWDLAKVFEVSPEEIDQFWQTYEQVLYETPGPKTDAVKYINKLSESHNITIITARGESFRQITENWLQSHGITYHRLIMTREKRQACALMNIDIMVEDAPEFIDMCEDIPVLLFDYPYNKGINKENIIRVETWKDVYEFLSNYTK